MYKHRNIIEILSSPEMEDDLARTSDSEFVHKIHCMITEFSCTGWDESIVPVSHDQDDLGESCTYTTAKKKLKFR